MPAGAFALYNFSMKRLSVIILSVCVLLYGCQVPDSDTSSESQFDKVSREIERLKAESQTATSTGDNIVIVVNFLSASLDEYFAVDSLWRYTDENITVSKSPRVFSRSGLRIGVAGPNFKARLNITKQQLKSSAEAELFIVIANGSTGYINIGREIYLPRFYYSNRWYTSVTYDFRRAGRSLKVTARKLPSGLIDMELTPVFSKFLSNGGDMELTELSTRLSAQPGQILVIGGTDTGEDNISTALFGYSKRGEKKQTIITVTPYTN